MGTGAQASTFESRFLARDNVATAPPRRAILHGFVISFDTRKPTTSGNSHFLTHEKFSFGKLKLQTSLPIECDVSRIRSTLPSITNLQERIMSVAGIASHLPFQSVNQAFFFQPRLDVVELGQAINSGDLTKAQQLYDALTALGQNTPVISRSRILGWNRIFLRWARPSKLEMQRERSRRSQPYSRIFKELTSEGGHLASPAPRRRDYSEPDPIPGQQHACVWHR